MSLQDDLDRLNRAINRAVLVVNFADGRRIEYNSIPNMILAADRLQAQISTSAGTRVRQIRMATSKGLSGNVTPDGFTI